MPGRGPVPKDPSKRARANKDVIPLRQVTIVPGVKPELPAFSITVSQNGMISTQEFEWPERTLLWWSAWDSHPLVDEFTAGDWEFLLTTARLHAAFWLGDLKVASEIRLREVEMLATISARQRGRLQTALAVGAEADAVSKTVKAVSARDRYGKSKPLGEFDQLED